MRARKRPYLPRIDRSLELFARLSRHLEFYFCYASFLVSSIGVGDLCLLYLWLRSQNYKLRPQNYKLRSHNYKLRPQNYKLRPQNYKLRLQNFKLRPQNYKLRVQNFKFDSWN